MDDPLTALMHAVQVMNLLKTLILKTLREREETLMEGHSLISSTSSDQVNEDDLDGQHEADMTCDLREDTSDADNVESTHSSEDEHDSPNKVKKRLMRQLEAKEDYTNDDDKKLCERHEAHNISSSCCIDD